MIPVETGANSDGFITTVFPDATGDMTARQDRMLAPFHGSEACSEGHHLKQSSDDRDVLQEVE